MWTAWRIEHVGFNSLYGCRPIKFWYDYVFEYNITVHAYITCDSICCSPPVLHFRVKIPVKVQTQ
jgi:hypothetical protein